MIAGKYISLFNSIYPESFISSNNIDDIVKIGDYD